MYISILYIYVDIYIYIYGYIFLKDFEVYDIRGIRNNHLFAHGDNQIYLNIKTCVCKQSNISDTAMEQIKRHAFQT